MSTGSAVPSDRDLRSALMGDKHRRSMYEDFRSGLSANTCDTPYGAPTGTAGDVNNLFTDKNMFQFHILGTQTILAPSRVTTGLNISQDLTNNDGIEYAFSICESPANTVVGILGQGAFTIGTDKPFYASINFTITDVSGSDVTIFGFRKNEAFQAAHSSYADLASIGNISGDIKTYTILAGGTPATTDTTLNWADTETHRLTVIVDSDGSLGTLTTGGTGQGTVGKVFYEVDGVAPTTVATTTFAFATGSVVFPFLYFINDTDVAESTIIKSVEYGYVGVGQAVDLAQQTY